MWTRILPAALACLLAVPAIAQTNQDSWVRLETTGAEFGAGELTLRLSPSAPRVRAVKLAADAAPVSLARVVVTYANGQIHYEDRPILLGKGEQSKPIDERGEARVVGAVVLSLPKGSPIPEPVGIAVWGLKESEADSDFKFRDMGAGSFVEVPVFYGTTRKREKDRALDNRTLTAFSGEISNQITYGRSVVTVPLQRSAGSIPRPMVVARIPLRGEDRSRDFTLATVEVLDKATFLAEANKKAASADRYKRQAFVFVHGYNVSFDDAIFRTAQIAYDIEFDGPALAFSWPSRGGTWDYVHDLNTAKASREGLRAFLEMVGRELDVDSVNLIAHSMGNDPVMEVLRAEAEIAARGGKSADFKLNEIIFAAPDVGRTLFEQFAAKIVGLAKGGVTLYASKNDLALSASKKVSSGITRAGDVSEEGILIVPGVESIDISNASTTVFSLNHSTFAEREHLVTDVRYLFERSSNKHPPDVRYAIYRALGSKAKPWWQYMKE